jgi:hypothetical protein
MGRRRAEAPAARAAGLNMSAAGMAAAAVGFLLEIGMVAAFLFWGFRHDSPWNLVLGLGVPAVVVVLWGIFMAPKSSRRLPGRMVAVASLAVFVLAGAALLAAGAAVLGVIMLVVAAAWFAVSWVVERK